MSVLYLISVSSICPQAWVNMRNDSGCHLPFHPIGNGVMNLKLVGPHRLVDNAFKRVMELLETTGTEGPGEQPTAEKPKDEQPTEGL